MSETKEAYAYPEHRASRKLDRYGRTPEQAELDRAMSLPEPKVSIQFEQRPKSTDVPLPGSVRTWCHSENGWQARIDTVNGEKITGEYRSTEVDAKYSAWATYRKMLEQIEMSEERAEYKPKPYLYPNGRVDVEALQELERRVTTLETERFAYPVDTRIAYYEQKIEEISAKWQKAERELCDAYNLAVARGVKIGEMADTIAELREKLQVANSVVEALNVDLSQRNAIIAEKNRELEQIRPRLSGAEALIRYEGKTAVEWYDLWKESQDV